MDHLRARVPTTTGAISKPLLLVILCVVLVAAVTWSVVRTRAVRGPSVGERVPIDIETVRETMRTEGFGRRK